MATKANENAETTEARDETSDGPLMDSMSAAVKKMIAKAKERGYVTYSEILKSFPHVEEDVNFLEVLYERFATAGVDVLEGGMLEDTADEYLEVASLVPRAQLAALTIARVWASFMRLPVP